MATKFRIGRGLSSLGDSMMEISRTIRQERAREAERAGQREFAVEMEGLRQDNRLDANRLNREAIEQGRLDYFNETDPLIDGGFTMPMPGFPAGTNPFGDNFRKSDLADVMKMEMARQREEDRGAEWWTRFEAQQAAIDSRADKKAGSKLPSELDIKRRSGQLVGTPKTGDRLVSIEDGVRTYAPTISGGEGGLLSGRELDFLPPSFPAQFGSAFRDSVSTGRHSGMTEDTGRQVLDDLLRGVSPRYYGEDLLRPEGFSPDFQTTIDNKGNDDPSDDEIVQRVVKGGLGPDWLHKDEENRSSLREHLIKKAKDVTADSPTEGKVGWDALTAALKDHDITLEDYVSPQDLGVGVQAGPQLGDIGVIDGVQYEFVGGDEQWREVR